MNSEKNRKPSISRKNEKQTSADNQRIIDSYDYLANAASTQDCTGLIPSAPKNRAELDAYSDLYQYRPPEVPIRDEET